MKEGAPRPEQIRHTESEMTDEQTELAEISEITLEDKGNFSINSPQETDSSGNYTWKSYLDRKKLMNAWAPPPDSPYQKFVKTKTINSISFMRDRIKPRHSEAELKCERELENLIKSGEIGKGTAIILDSGGPHSVAMAAELVKHGFQPVVMLDSIPHSKGITRSEQSLATLLYFAEQMNRIKQTDQIKYDAPPVFILDCHRGSRDLAFGTTLRVINTHAFDEHDLPSSEEFKKIGIRRIVYLNEGDQKGEIRPEYQSSDRLPSDLKLTTEKWEQADIKVVYTGIDPHVRIRNREMDMKELL